jgi:amidohydrolase
MIEEGALADPKPDAVFALHVVPQYQAGEIAYRSGGAMASSDKLGIVVRGKQTHAAYPWMGVDPIAVASRIVLALHALPGRQMDARLPSVVSIGTIHGGERYNIIPDRVELRGTIRTLEPSMQPDLHRRIRTTATKIAESAGASAEVDIQTTYPVTYNDPRLVARMEPTLRRVAGPDRLLKGLPRTGAEDFSFFGQEAPGFYFWLGVRAPDVAEEDAASTHSPLFRVDESALLLGVRAMANLAVDFLVMESAAGAH